VKSLTILLPDLIDEIIRAEASKRGVDAIALCSGIITEHCLVTSRNLVYVTEASVMPANVPEQKGGFDVHKHFPNHPHGSRELAQLFVDEARKIDATEAFVTPTGVGVGFRPNFVWIERIKSQREGVTVSFYGLPNRHGNHPLLRKSRANWSRAYACTRDEMKSLLPHVKISHDLKRGC
jgi:hypothetical protein